MTKKKIIAISVVLGVMYLIGMGCLGVFGAVVASFLMSWVPLVLKILGVFIGFVVITLLPLRVWQATEINKERMKNALLQKKRVEEEIKAKKLEKVAEAFDNGVNFYD